MIRSDEDDEFDRIERENAYGWSNEEFKTDEFMRAKTLILGGLRRIETAIREKNT
jgi:hypothetical protein